MKNRDFSSDQLNKIYESLLNRLDEGVHVVDANGRTLLYNNRMAEIESMHKEDVLDKRLLDVFHFPGNEQSTLLKAVLHGQTTRNVKQTYFNQDGKEITTINDTYPLILSGEIAGAFEIARDITKVEKLLQENLQKKTGHFYSFESIIGQSRAIREVVEEGRRATRTNSSVLIIGETGTGKELFAQSIHQASARSTGPFVSQNCAALPDSLIEGLLFGTTRGAFTGAIDRPGLIELANQGTLLLDELNSLSPALQAKLLRVLQEHSIRRVGATKDTAVDVRIIATMNEDPLDAIAQNHLRKDLYYRLSVVTLFIPPLRDRGEDVPLLSQSFVEKYNRLFQMNVKKVSDEVMSYFLSYNWPGNVRELEHAVEGSMNMMAGDEEIRFEHLPFPLRRRFNALSLSVPATAAAPATPPSTAAENPNQETMPRGQREQREQREQPVQDPPILTREHDGERLQGQLRDYEQQLVLQVLQRHKGNISKTAKELGLSRQSLQYRLRKWNLHADQFQNDVFYGKE